MPISLRKVWLNLFLFSGVIVLCFYAYYYIHKTRYFPVKMVHVYGAHHLDHKELQNLLTPLLAHNFFAVDMEVIKDRLRQFSWVEDIAIRRIWPDQVNIVITERHPIALWPDGSLLSANGDLFNQGEYKGPPDLPRFVGANGMQGIMLQFFNDINRELLLLHAKIAYLEITPYQMWRLTLDNGIHIQLGHKNILTRMDQFVKVYPKIIGSKVKDVEYVDLRYPNGMAIRWKDATEI